MVRPCVLAFASVLAVGCSNDVDPRVIPGGGIGDGEIDGEVNVHVIDAATDAPIGNATVRVGSTDKTTDEKGLAVFADVEGAQTISVEVTGYRSTVWVGANGANVTIPVPALTAAQPDSATLRGTISGWDAISVPAGHVKAAVVFYSHSDNLGDAANNLATPLDGNRCLTPNVCNWTLVTRAGASVTVVAAIVDVDPKGTAEQTDDTFAIIGWAVKAGVTVDDGIDQSGLVLTPVEAGNLQNVTVDYGTPPAGLPETGAFVGIEVSDDDIVQLPLFLATDMTALLVPKPSVFSATATYRLTAVAQTASASDGAQSIVIRRGETGTSLAAGEWLVPPTGVTASRTSASFERVTGAKVHNIGWQDSSGETILEITVFDGKLTSVDVPALVALPTSGALTARVGALGADLDPTDFSLDDDADKVWGLAIQPFEIR